MIKYGDMMNENPLLKLEAFGQSVWLDYIPRHLMESGELARLIAEDGLSGITSNLNIFDEAIEGGDAYDDAIALSSAKVAYRMYQEIFSGERFGKLAELGACPQRLLWASTGTKDPRYSDVPYVDALIGPETVNTMPRKTLEAYRDHGNPKPRLEEYIDQARSSLDRLAGLGIDMEEVTRRLEEEGIEKFKRPFESLMANIQKKCSGLDLPGA